jgi:glycosyltransferase involved in cell wall biosynthesis
VAYFGDLWALDGYIDWESASWARRRLAPLMERTVVSAADGIITTTDGSSEYFRTTYGHECPPVQTLWNGVPLAERDRSWNSKGLREPQDDIVITYTGFFMGLQTPEYFLNGFRLFLDRHPESRLKFRVVGDFGAFGSLPVELGLEGNIEVLGTVPFSQVRDYQLDSDILLLILPPQPGNELKNPSKTVEYLLARRPVLAVAPEGDLTSLIKDLGAGYTASHDPESVCSAIEQIHRDMAAGRQMILKQPGQLDGRMDMDRGGREMAAFLDRIVEERS